MSDSTFIFSRNDAGSIQVEFKDGDNPFDLETNQVTFSVGTHNVLMQVTDAALGLASLQLSAATLSDFGPGLYDSRITIGGSVPTMVTTYINSDQTTPDGATYNNSIIIDVDTSDLCIANSGGGGGVPGPPGEQGPAGEQGPEGEEGPQGPEGPAGDEGPRGPEGDEGPQGDVGDQGDPGDEGPKGDDGTSVTLEGSVATVGNLPNGKAEGVLYIVLDSGDGYVSNGDDTWTNVGPIQGPKGDTGDAGDKGDEGDEGPRGLPGEQGGQGLQGDPGEKGDKGDEGDEGSPGTPGDPGDNGAPGANGPSVTIATGTGAPPSGWLTTSSTGDFFVRTG